MFIYTSSTKISTFHYQNCFGYGNGVPQNSIFHIQTFLIENICRKPESSL